LMEGAPRRRAPRGSARRARAPRGERARRPRRAPSESERATAAARREGGETFYRILWALPWAALAITIIIAGGGIFAAVVLGTGASCMLECFNMAKVAQAARGVAILGLAGLVAAAYWGGHYQMVLAFAAVFPVLFLALAARGRVEG